MPKKVLELITLSEIGGAQKVVYYLAKELNKIDFDITVASSPGGELVSWLRNFPSVKVVEIEQFTREINFKKDLLLLFKLIGFIRKEGFEVVHCHSSKAGMIGRIAAWLAGVPCIVFTVHGWSFDHYSSKVVKKLFIFIERLLSMITTKTVCVSKEVANRGIMLGALNRKKTDIVENGIEMEKLESGKSREQLGVGADVVLVGTVCRLGPPKLPLLFIQTAEEVLRKYEFLQEKVKFVVVGDGPYFQQCLQYINDRRLQNHIVLLGNREDARQLIAAMDIFMLLSRSEGLPIVLLEALSAGKPIIASDVGGVAEAVVHGTNGLLVKDNEKHEIVRMLFELINSKELRDNMGQKSKQFLPRFSSKKMAELYEQVYSNR